ncbi:uro-adherence factor A [Euwallacea fornicatus]|uniref:uro-adherence factor A n=1 Tax=Euwallacea fornicatus TaxID=995702 RepID=UPI00338D7E34
MERSSSFLLKKFFSSLSTSGETSLSNSNIEPESIERAVFLTEQNEDKTSEIKGPSSESSDASGDLDNSFKENYSLKYSEKECVIRNDVLEINCWNRRVGGFKGASPLQHKLKAVNPEFNPIDRETLRLSSLRPVSPGKLSLFSRLTFEQPKKQLSLKENETRNQKIQQNLWSSEGFHESMSLEYFSDPSVNNKRNCERKGFRFEDNLYTQDRSRDGIYPYQATNPKPQKKNEFQRTNTCDQSKRIQSETQTNSTMFARKCSLFSEYSDFQSISKTMKLITANEPIYLKRENQSSDKVKDKNRPIFDFLNESNFLFKNCSKDDTQRKNFQSLKESEKLRYCENSGNNSKSELPVASNNLVEISKSLIENTKMSVKEHEESDVELLISEAWVIAGTSANALEKEQNIVPINCTQNKETSNNIHDRNCIAGTSKSLLPGNMLVNVPEIKSPPLFISRKRRCRTSYTLNESCILYNENLLNHLLQERPQIMKAHKKLSQKRSFVRKSEEVLACTYIKRYRKGKKKIFSVKKRDKPVCRGQYKPPEHKFVEKLTHREFADNTSVSDTSAEGESVSTPTSYVTDETRSDVLSTTENLSEYQKILRDEIDKLCKNPKLLFSRFSDPVPEDVDSTDLLISIHKLIFNVLDDFENGRVPFFCVPKDSAANCTYKDGRYQMREHIHYQKKSAKSKTSSIIRPQFNLILFILNKIRILLETRTKLTKREIYYLLKPMVTTQGITDRVIRIICRMLGVGPWTLNLTTQKGLVYGDIKMILTNGESIDCNVPGTSIPINICDICEIQSNAYFIMVVEKESIFHKLLEEDLPNRLPRPFVLITGKGFPDNITQLFLKKLWMLISVPVFILVDADPDGIAVMLNYRFGSITPKLSISRNNSNKEVRKGQKRTCEKKSNSFTSGSKRIVSKSRKSPKYYSGYSQYDSSKMDLSLPYHLPKAPPDDSTIYVKSYPEREIFPVIDFSKNAHSISSLSGTYRIPKCTSMRLIYKFNNFKARLQKYLASSLLTLPIPGSNDFVRNVKGASHLTWCSRQKLSILDIPSEFLDEDIDGSEYAFYDLSKADLNEEDRSMIECIAMKEDEKLSVCHLQSKRN